MLFRNEVDSLILRNRVFMVRNAEMWPVLFSNEADLLMLRNRVHVAKRSDMSIVVKGLQFAETQESWF